jgi:hypothetical protein
MSTLSRPPEILKVLVYSTLTTEEVTKCNLPIEKLIFFDITGSLPGTMPVESPHVSVYWYGPNVSSEQGRSILFKSTKIEPQHTKALKNVIHSKVGGDFQDKEDKATFVNFTMPVTYQSIADLGNAIAKAAKISVELVLEFENITRKEKDESTLPKNRILGEKSA